MLDVFEKEPSKIIFYNFILGFFSYIGSFLGFYFFLKLSNYNFNIGDSFVKLSLLVIASSLMMFFSQVFAALIGYFLFRKEYDTMPDYILYFSTIAIGFNISDIFVSNLIGNTTNKFLIDISDSLYFTTYFSSIDLPFILATVGASFYLYKLSSFYQGNLFKTIAFFVFTVSIFSQIIFYISDFIFINYAAHNPNAIYYISLSAKNVIVNVSLFLLLSGVSLSVLFDSYLVVSFANKVLDATDETTNDIKNYKVLINPFTYLFLKNSFLMKYIDPKCTLDSKEIRRFSKLALLNFNQPNNSSKYLIEGIELLMK